MQYKLQKVSGNPYKMEHSNANNSIFPRFFSSEVVYDAIYSETLCHFLFSLSLLLFILIYKSVVQLINLIYG